MGLIEFKAALSVVGTDEGQDQALKVVSRILDSEKTIEDFLEDPLCPECSYKLRRQIVSRIGPNGFKW